MYGLLFFQAYPIGLNPPESHRSTVTLWSNSCAVRFSPYCRFETRLRFLYNPYRKGAVL